MKKVDYYACGLTRSISDEVLEELRCMPPNVRFNLVKIRRFGVANGRSQRALMDHAQPQ